MTTPRTELDTRFSDPAAQPTGWEDTLEAIKQAEIFWISTVRTDGRPHVTPLVAVWLDGALHFSTGPDEQKARNLASNPRVALTTGANEWQSGLDVVSRARRPASPTHSSSTGSPRPGHKSGTGDGNTRSVRMAFDTTSGPPSCSLSAQRRSLPSPRAVSATPDIASEAPTPHTTQTR
jgi:Pyridoxamine 5'-phosphate oxidase